MRKAKMESIIYAKDKGEDWADDKSYKLWKKNPALHEATRFEMYLRKANEGDPISQHQLAYIFLLEKKDPEQSAYWFIRAAENGYIKAMIRCALSFSLGSDGFTKDPKKAFEWALKAAEAGSAYGQYLTGNNYWFGDGVDKDSNKAIEWLTKSAEQGYTPALKYLGDVYAQLGGEHIIDNKELYSQYEKEAFSFYCKAAERGDEWAQTSIAYKYKMGFGVEQDIDKAIYWYEQASLGDVDSARNDADELRKTYNKPLTQSVWDNLISDYKRRKLLKDASEKLR